MCTAVTDRGIGGKGRSGVVGLTKQGGLGIDQVCTDCLLLLVSAAACRLAVL